MQLSTWHCLSLSSSMRYALVVCVRHGYLPSSDGDNNQRLALNFEMRILVWLQHNSRQIVLEKYARCNKSIQIGVFFITGRVGQTIFISFSWCFGKSFSASQPLNQQRHIHYVAVPLLFCHRNVARVQKKTSHPVNNAGLAAEVVWFGSFTFCGLRWELPIFHSPPLRRRRGFVVYGTPELNTRGKKRRWNVTKALL